MKTKQSLITATAEPHIHFAPTWPEIRGKAHMYKTAQLKSTGEYVQIVRLAKFVDGLELTEPCFICRIAGFPGTGHYTTGELCNFCL